MKFFLIQPKALASFQSPPLGLRLIATILKKNNYNNIVDIDRDKGDDVYKTDFTGEKVIAGISTTFMTIKEAFNVAKYIKGQNKNALVVLGGPHTTLVPEESIDNENVDIIALGEGEFTFLEIAQRVERNLNFEGINGIWYKINGKVIKNEKREFLKDLNLLPIPDREFFKDSLYQKKSLKKEREYFWHLMTSQSCPFSCNMCQPALRTIAGPYRQRSVENVIKEILYLKETYNARNFNFYDNDMGVNRKWMIDFCNEAKKIGDLNMVCCGRANLLDYDILKLMKEAGFASISFGAESGSDRVLTDIMNKKTTVKQVIEFANNCYKLGINCNAFWMLASPGETIEEMMKTIELASQLPVFYCHFHIATPNPGTNYYFDALNGGYLNMVSWNDVDNRKTPTIIKNNVNRQDIIKIDKILVKTMIRNGWRYWQNGHTLSFVNSRLFVKRNPRYVFLSEIYEMFKDFKPYHIKNVFYCILTFLGLKKVKYRESE